MELNSYYSKRHNKVFVYMIFLFLHATCESKSVINLKYLQENANNNHTSPFFVENDYGTCYVIYCGSEICASGPNAMCEVSFKSGPNKTSNSNYKCTCNKGFITYEEDEIFKCCYPQKNAMTALLLEFFLGFGVGHFYIGNNYLGILKALIYSLFCFSSCAIFIKILKQGENEGRSFVLKVTSTICLLLCSCTYIGWQIVDSILFSVGGYTDGNGADLFISY